ncbi:MAG: hypothetical protein JWQ32_2708 [Marmoricola sp.]|nr:hypothetical protein [Marmoricola sp.]
MHTRTQEATTDETQGWPIVGLLLDALTRRDFDAFGDCLATDVRFRALVPRGPFELRSATETADRFRTWFGGTETFEVIDASVGQLGTRLYARWRIRMFPPGDPESARVAEQHLFTTGTDRIESIDLLCSGFHPECVPTCALP